MNEPRTSILILVLMAVLTAIMPATRAQNVTIPDLGLNTAVRSALQKPIGPLTQLDMLSLTNLSANFRNITNLQGLEVAQNLASLDLQYNQITNACVITNLTRLTLLDISENQFGQLTIPSGMTNLTTIRLENGRMTNLSLSAGLMRLTSLRVGFNQLKSLILPADATNLTELSAFRNQITNMILPPSLPNLITLNLDGNQLSRLQLPAGLAKLSLIALGENQLTSFTVPLEMTSLTTLRLNDNQLTNLTLSSSLSRLSLLVTSRNPLSRLIFPPGLTSMAFLALNGNQFTSLTLPPDMQQLTGVFVSETPLTTLVLSETLAAAGMASVVDSLRSQGVSVFTYPLAVQIVPPVALVGAVKIGITAPPGVYWVQVSANLTFWSHAGIATNPLGSVEFIDVTTNDLPQRFYRLVRQPAPSNMVFIPPATFTMGSPDNEAGRQGDEGPQTVVRLTRGFWIGKYEVTQEEYLAITGENHSEFSGDLNRPVETVSFLAASNYCFLLTARDQASGRIPSGSHYRLPTEAEWECAARAGTSTRFSHGDDPDLTALDNFAWFGAHDGNTTHPVGQKLPNAWGLYDMEGNVWEWCQDWYGPYQGGSVIDPQGAIDPRTTSSNPFGFKVIRGGAWEASESDCRSASRWFEVAYPLVHDSRVGFRVVLADAPQP